MVLHIGKGSTVKAKDIIGIFDMDNATVSSTTRAYLARATRERRVREGSGEDIPRSFLLCEGSEVVLSPISSLSLAARARSNRLERYGE